MDLRLPFGLFPAKLRGLDIVASPTLIAQQGKNQPQILHYVVGKEPRNAIALGRHYGGAIHLFVLDRRTDAT